ncbi:hypothetical protein BOX15_Mlig024132g3 [Macrostomum lignano]|uniref:Protein kinase domain-containing protein n=1 Tax=Macrostomum lignano TaxID=282301 RepID=A0A267FVK8_9PLAT|nr:hypothetical protein BOX15_Mlig024132g3 [Macrostomum lignano]
MPPSPGRRNAVEAEYTSSNSRSSCGSFARYDSRGSPASLTSSASSILDNIDSVCTLNSASTASTAAAAKASGKSKSLSANVEEAPPTPPSPSSTTSSPAPQAFHRVYKLENVIGSGSYASVYRCVDRQSNKNFAVKVLEDKLLSSYQRQLIRNEESILLRLDHRNIIRLVAVFSDEPDIKRMVFEFADQLDICLALVTSPNFGERAIREAAKQLFSGLAYLHEKRIMHRDLKLENLLAKSDATSGEMVLKISDFGYAVELAAGQSFFTLKNTIIGSFEYMSPELISSQEYSTKIDCWAAGVIVYFLFTGDFPFRGANVTEMARCIVKRHFALDFSAPEWSAASRNAVDFISSILSTLYNRPNASDLLKHPWLSAPENHPLNATTDQPLPIMRHKERLEFLQHEAEMKQKRLYNNSSSNKPWAATMQRTAVEADCALLLDGSFYRRSHRRRHFWQAKGSHEAVFASEFIVNSAITCGRRRCRSLTTRRIGPWTQD